MTEEQKNKISAILEIYTAIQCEGSRAGYPTVVVRTSGCTHRCYFGEGGWCDSWYTSIHPEKPKYSFDDIVKIYDDNPNIKEMMLTGGASTMHPKLVNELTKFANERNIVITIETEGSHFLQTDYPIGLISLSPKFSNSVPVLGTKTPQGKIVDQKMIDRHNKFRLNYDAIADTLLYHKDFHIKAVVNPDLSILNELQDFINQLADKITEKSKFSEGGDLKSYIRSKVWLMPAGDDRESLIKSYGPIMNAAVKYGFKFTGRPHIIAFDTQREV